MRLVHAIPGRFRILGERDGKVADLLGRLHDGLSSQTGVWEVQTNPLTGSVVVLYDAANTAERSLFRKVEEISGEPLSDDLETGLREPASPRGSADPAHAVRETVQKVNALLLRRSGGSIDLRYVVPLFLAVFGTLKLLRQGPIPAIPWYSLYWMSFRTFMIFNPTREVDTRSHGNPTENS